MAGGIRTRRNDLGHPYRKPPSSTNPFNSAHKLSPSRQALAELSAQLDACPLDVETERRFAQEIQLKTEWLDAEKIAKMRVGCIAVATQNGYDVALRRST